MSKQIAHTDFPIGTKFIPVGRRNRLEHTIVDTLKTYNSAGEMVAFEYLASHEFMGQTSVTKFLHVAVAMGLIVKS